MADPFLPHECVGSAAPDRPRRQPLCIPAGRILSLATRRARVPLLGPQQPASGRHLYPPSRQRLAGPRQRPRALRPGLALSPSCYTEGPSAKEDWLFLSRICTQTFALFIHFLGFPGSSAGKESACNSGTPVYFLDWEDPLEKG